jgi:uncharacterized protein (DUF1810 family)
MNERPFDLNRFIDAHASAYDQALAELKRGCKQTHWMWFIFPQFDGLGSSAQARRYAIRSIEEAAAYLADPILGTRLVECAHAMLRHQGRSARDILGFPDNLKLRSCMTLFSTVKPTDIVFSQVLDAFYAGEEDSRTLEFISCRPPNNR